MTESPIEDPADDWLEQQIPGDPTEQPAGAAGPANETEADEADVLEQHMPLLPSPENYSDDDTNEAG
jgi:hypothetical protein